MARITTRTGLGDYIKNQLGAPIITIEVTDTQINQIIDDAIQKFTEYAYGTLEGTVVAQINGAGDYPMPENMTNIIKFSKGSTSNITHFNANFGSGYVPNLWSEQYFSGSLTGGIMEGILAISTTKALLDKFFADDIVYNYNPYKNILQVQENYTGGCVIHYQYEYTADDEGDGIFNHEWIKAYCVAKTKFLWGTVTGKYSQTLVGGATVNYADMKSEASEEITRLNEELLTKWSDPAPIDIA